MEEKQIVSTKIIEFPSEVIKELKYYVYRLIDPRNGETFYVGKGKGNRVFQHSKGEILQIEKEGEVDEIDEKLFIIKDIIKNGLDVIFLIHRHGMDEKISLEVESALIDCYPNAKNKIGGIGSGFGCMNVVEIMQKYKAEVLVFQHNILTININRSIQNEKIEIYDAVRFAWKINLDKAKKVDFIFAIEKGIVVGIFTVIEWKNATKVKFPEFNKYIKGRFGFVGEEANDEIKKLYINKRLPSNFRAKGSASPLLYHFM